MLRSAVLFVVAAGSLGGAAAASNSYSSYSLLTDDQVEIQRSAVSLIGSPAVAAAREAGLKRFEAAPPAALDDGRATLAGALDEAVYGAVLAAVNDPASPKVIWNEQLPFGAAGGSVPGGRYAGDDPDRIYRTIAVDPAYRYEITGHRQPGASLDFSFDAITGPALWGKTKAQLPARDIDIRPDGSFVITADSTPADGRRNHLQLAPGTVNILVRDLVADWARQSPNGLTVKRLDQTPTTAPGQDAAAQRAAKEVEASIDASLKFIAGIWKNPPNRLFPVVRGLGDGVKGGVVAVDRFKIAKSRALVITLDPLNAKYLGIQVADPWLRSVDYQRRISSLNNFQAVPNADGSYTFVLAPEDPGVKNWVDTGGLHDGVILVRWEVFPGAPDLGKAVREIRELRVADIAASLGAAAHVTTAERQQELAARSAAYERRIAAH